MTEHVKLVIFEGEKDFWGVNVTSLKKIVSAPQVTPMSYGPFFIKGMIQLGNKVIPVVDLRKHLGYAAGRENVSPQVLITESRDKWIGFLVDVPLETLKIAGENIKKPPGMIATIGIEYISGVAKADHKMIILLDLKKILSDDDMKKIEVLPR